jgi:uncharacterized protein
MLTLPLMLAAFTAGAVGGVHCLAMCGGLGHWLARSARMRVIPIVLVPHTSAAQGLSAWRALAYLHAGRLSTYALIGALAGAGGGVLWSLPAWLPVRAGFMLLGSLALIVLGWRLTAWHLPPAWFSGVLPAWLAWPKFAWLGRLARALPRPANYHPLFNGMAWGWLPCGLLYAVLPFALLSGAAWSGAVLLLLFGVGTLPWLLLAQTRLIGGMRTLRPLVGVLLLAWGAYGLLQLLGQGVFGASANGLGLCA